MEHLLFCKQEFPIGGIVRKRKTQDLVKFQNQQYSLDRRRYHSCDAVISLTHAIKLSLLAPERYFGSGANFILRRDSLWKVRQRN